MSQKLLIDSFRTYSVVLYSASSDWKNVLIRCWQSSQLSNITLNNRKHHCCDNEFNIISVLTRFSLKINFSMTFNMALELVTEPFQPSVTHMKKFWIFWKNKGTVLRVSMILLMPLTLLTTEYWKRISNTMELRK